jgi:hypothetical protein
MLLMLLRDAESCRNIGCGASGVHIKADQRLSNGKRFQS